MNKIDMYVKCNRVQRASAVNTFQQFKHLLKWRSDGCDSVLDVGCGPGDITMDIMLPILPANFTRLVGIDLSKEAIEYARKTYVHPKIAFEQFDLEIELEKQSLNGIDSFDHILSNFCLMWVQNQKTCIQNLYKLLKPGGDMLIAFIAGHTLFDIYKELAQSNRWAQYMTDVDEKTSPYHYLKDPAGDFRNLLSDCGFKDCDVEVYNKEHVFENTNTLENNIHSSNRFIDRIPAGDKQVFLDEIINQFVEKGCALGDFHKDPKCQFKFPYRLIIAYARK